MRKNIVFSITIFAMVFFHFSCTKPEMIDNTLEVYASNEKNVNSLDDKTFRITPAKKPTSALALQYRSQDDNVYTSFAKYNADSTSQLWHFTQVKPNFFRISNAYSGKVLAASSAAESNAPVWQTRYDTSDVQLWKLIEISNNYYGIRNKATGLCLEANWINADSGMAILNTCEKKAEQLWKLTSVDAIYVDVDAVNFFRRTEGWIASDGAASILMNDNRVLWTMGDSHIDDYFYATQKVYCLFQVRNAALLQPAGSNWNWKQTTTLTGNEFGGFQSYFKNKPNDDYWMWPGCGFQIPGNDTVYVYNEPLKKTGNGSWDWANDGHPVWAKIRSSDMKVVAYDKLQNFDGINFGIGFSKENDGYIYAFGNKQTFIYNNIYVARFPASDPNKPWTFWTGSTWSLKVQDAKRVVESASSGSTVVKYKGKYICISTEFSVGCDQGSMLYGSVSDSPIGPFTWRKAFYEIPDRLQGHIPFFYAPNAHPQFENDANELLITYDINGYGDCVNICKNGRMDPDHYRPKAIRVPFSLIQ